MAAPQTSVSLSLSFALALLATAIAPARARACQAPGFEMHTLVAAEQAVDHTPPVMKQPVAVTLQRGAPPRGSGCGSSSDNCDDGSSLWLNPQAADDRTMPEYMGYRLKLVAGALPPGAQLPTGDVRATAGITLRWSEDVAHDDPPLISFTLELRAVDLAGNASEPVLVPIVDGDDGSSGCALTPAHRGSALLTAVPLALLALGVRRRRKG